MKMIRLFVISKLQLSLFDLKTNMSYIANKKDGGIAHCSAMMRAQHVRILNVNVKLML